METFTNQIVRQTNNNKKSETTQLMKSDLCQHFLNKQCPQRPQKLSSLKPKPPNDTEVFLQPSEMAFIIKY